MADTQLLAPLLQKGSVDRSQEWDEWADELGGHSFLDPALDWLDAHTRVYVGIVVLIGLGLEALGYWLLAALLT